MEQTLEGGEKHLELLKALCCEALPEFEYAAHTLDHERDLFVMTLRSPDGRTRVVSWTRMVLFDAERIPQVVGDFSSPLRARILNYLRSRAGKPEIVVTFRHMEEGWVDTPEPKREKRRRRKGRPERRAEAPRRPEKAAAPRRDSPRREGPRPAPVPKAQPSAARGSSEGAPSGRPGGRRRFRRRRHGGRGGGSPGQPPTAPKA